MNGFRIALIGVAILGLTVAGFAQPDLVWMETHGSSSHSSTDLCQTHNGDFMHLAQVSYTGDTVYRIAPNGDEIWHRTYGETGNYDRNYEILELPDGDFLVAGYEWIDAQSAYDARLIRIDSHGEVVWTTYVGSVDGTDYGNGIARSSNGRIFMCGQVWTGAFSEGAIWEFNENGELLNSISFIPAGHSGSMNFSGIQVTSDNHLVMVGGGYYETDNWDGWILKTTLDGTMVWQTIPSLPDWNHITDVREAGDGTFYFAGNSVSADGDNRHPWHGKFSANGSMEFDHFYGMGDGNQVSYFLSINPDSDGNWLLAGRYEADGSSHADALLLKVNHSDGSTIWEILEGDPAAGSDEGFSDVAVLRDGSLMVAGDGDFGATVYPPFLARYGTEELALVDVAVVGGSFGQFIDPEGGDLVYDVTITNTLPVAQVVQGWAEAILPNGTSYGLVMVSLNLVPGNTNFYNDLVQSIPGMAPAGYYMFRVNLGLHPFVYTSDSFWFRKDAVAVDTNQTPRSNWAQSDWVEQAAVSANLTDIEATQPGQFSLSQVYPNPFNSTVHVSLQVPRQGDVTVDIVNVQGRVVGQLHHGPLAAGHHEFSWTADALASGVYFLRATVAGQEQQLRKVALVR
ncbi:T9SS type A sorting domain-containing protein [bacterium]|nr:T9SS type A sorting domain-containing protein [bacterium]